MRVVITKRGTHLVRIAEINNDIPSPGECVLEAVVAVNRAKANRDTLEWMTHEEAVAYAEKCLETAIKEAQGQGWEFRIEMEEVPEAPATPE